MSGANWLLVAAIITLFLVSGVLALSETAFTRMSRVRALALEEEGRSGATRLARMLERPERTLNSLLLVILVCQLVSANLTGVLLEQNFGTIGFVLGIVVEIAVFFVFFEVVPKTFAIQHTDRAALLVAPILSFLTNFAPLRVVSRALIGLANVVLPGRGLKEGPFVSEEEIRQMADVAAEEEAIERDERKLIHSIFEFGDMVVREAMTPRTDMVAIDADASIEDGISNAIEAGFSRLPAYEESTDNIIGLLFLKDLVALARASKREEPVRTALREAVFVPEQKRVAELLREMQTKQFHMAIVIDEYGGTSGVVTLEDLLEEIVGDITDEYDIEEPTVEHLSDGTLRVPGGTSIDDVSDELGVELPDTEWDTVGGLVFNLLGHVPEEGECVRFQGLEFRTERVKGRRIVSVHIRPKPDSAAEPVGAK
ncbi:MAG TPA: hemolysin family protein [Acidimicrobiia bacterium]|nr:hemolysin family protein [Acidimicrobiia bacterium]